MKEIKTLEFNDPKVKSIKFLQDDITSEIAMQLIMQDEKTATDLFNPLLGYLRINTVFGKSPLNFEVRRKENKLLFKGDINQAIQLLENRILIDQGVLLPLKTTVQSIFEDQAKKTKQAVSFWTEEPVENVMHQTSDARKEVL